MTENRTHKKAVIIGAGVGGLSAARALKSHGWAVRVLERASSLPTTGTALGMWPAALKALDAIGCGHAVRAAAGQVRAGDDIRTGLRTPAGKTMVATANDIDVRLIARPALLETLAEGVDITFDTSVAGTDIDSGADAFTGADVFADADVIVGADGTFSRTRTRVMGERFTARSLGAVAWRGTVDGTVREYGETWAPGMLFGVTPTGRDATNWYACIRAAHTFDGPHLPRLTQLFGSSNSSVTTVLNRIDEGSILHHELFDVRGLRSYVSGNIALIGDAAHSMGPFLGRGACEAIIDGVTLGQSLAETDDIETALAVYDLRRRRSTTRLVRASRAVGRFAMMGAGSSVRNAALGGAGRVIARRRHPTGG